MSDFIITETDRPGIEKAAQWHELCARHLEQEVKSWNDGELWAMFKPIIEDHRINAQTLRRLLEPRSSYGDLVAEAAPVAYPAEGLASNRGQD